MEEYTGVSKAQIGDPQGNNAAPLHYCAYINDTVNKIQETKNGIYIPLIKYPENQTLNIKKRNLDKYKISINNIKEEEYDYINIKCYDCDELLIIIQSGLSVLQ